MSTAEPLDRLAISALEPQRLELAGLIRQHTRPSLTGDAHQACAVPGLHLVRYEHSRPSAATIAQPALCVFAHGSKEVWLGEERYVYDPLHFLVMGVAMPVRGCLLNASPEDPSLLIRLDIDPAEIHQLIADAGPQGVPRPSERGLYVERMESPLLDALIRLVRLVETPRDIPMLAPLIRREILYRLLRGKQGHRLHEIALCNSQTHRVSQAVEWLNRHYQQPLRIDELASRVNLSSSTLHHRFKAVTSMSPLQYQKQLRLQEARRLMVNEGLEAAAACYRVGYESPSQFSREYSRAYGAPPSRDVARMRAGS